MIKFWNEYHLPASLEDALELLARYDGRARIVAGGTDLLLDLPDAYYSGKRPHFDALVDVTRIAGADTIREEDGWIVIGCGVTHTQIIASPIIQKRAAALASASAVVGGPQVRNVATLVGNIAHALPAADGLIACLVLDAQAQVKRQGAAKGQCDW
ncbi:MAG: FAD binding domain-containing protein, partial [Acidobacteriota bacterium]